MGKFCAVGPIGRHADVALGLGLGLGLDCARGQSSGANVSLNLLWALEGALSGLPWQEVAREHRTSLLLALDEPERRFRADTARP